MSSGFVSGGTADAPIERSDEWLAAQQELEANRRRKAEEARLQGGKSLFETLEANKAAKQDAFEEANKLKNQFRSLDEDEIEFLDSVLESTRAEELRVKKETAEGLEMFRKQQEEADKKLRAGIIIDTDIQGSPTEEEGQWTSGAARKRKRQREKEGLKGVKLRKSSSTDEQPPVPLSPPPKLQVAEVAAPKIPSGPAGAAAEGTRAVVESRKATEPTVTKITSASASVLPKAKFGLVDYGSDEDEDDD